MNIQILSNQNSLKIRVISFSKQGGKNALQFKEIQYVKMLKIEVIQVKLKKAPET